MRQKEFSNTRENLSRIVESLKSTARNGSDLKWQEYFNEVEEYCDALDNALNDLLAYSSMFGHNMYDYVVLGMQLGIEDLIINRKLD